MTSRRNRITELIVVALLSAIVTVPTAWAGSKHGIQEFTANGTWTAPPSITSVLVEMWGGGGGGGPYSTFGGGSGSYSHSVVTVKPHKAYTVVVGAGGLSQINGSDSQFVDSKDNILLFAGGGQAGGSTAVGEGGAEDTNAMIHHPGNPGPGLFVRSAAVIGNSNPAPGFDGTGGVGGNPGSVADDGNPGYVLLIW